MLIRGLRLVETIKSDVAEHEGGVGDGVVRIQPDCIPAFFNGFLILSKDGVNNPRQESMRRPRARIGLYAKLAGLFGLFHAPRHHHMEGSRDEIVLRLTRSLAQVVCLLGVVRSDGGFSNIAVHAPQCRISHGEFGVNLDGMLEEGHSGSRTS